MFLIYLQRNEQHLRLQENNFYKAQCSRDQILSHLPNMSLLLGKSFFFRSMLALAGKSSLSDGSSTSLHKGGL